MLSFFTGLVAIAKAFPIVDKWIDQFVGFYIATKLKNIEQDYSRVSMLRKNLLYSLELNKDNSDEERVLLMRELHNLK